MAAIALCMALTPCTVLAMSSPGHQRVGHCELVGGEKLSAGPAAGAALCAEVERAIKARAPGALYRVRIDVLSPSRLRATPIVGGTTLPAQNVAVMDGKLNEGSIKRFAASVAAVVVKASKL